MGVSMSVEVIHLIGAQSAMIILMLLMLVWYVVSWDIQDIVRDNTIHILCIIIYDHVTFCT